jgi:hypothetical protein
MLSAKLEGKPPARPRMTKPLFILAAALALIGCTRDETWHQKLTLVIDTPEGEVSGSVIQRIDWQGATGLYKTAFQSVDPS